ncbi:MAG: phage head-tail connector protein [Clostridia bacterium]
MTDLEMLDKLKLLAGITDNTQDNLLQLLLDIVTDKVLANTNQPYLPTACGTLAVEIAYDSYLIRQQGANAEAGQITGSVSSVSNNGQSVGYRAGDYASIAKSVSDAFLKDYAARLAPFRKAGW